MDDDRSHDSDHGRNEEIHDREAHEDPEHGHDVEGLERVTAPMQEFGSREVGIGFAVLAVGLVVTFVVPLLLT